MGASPNVAVKHADGSAERAANAVNRHLDAMTNAFAGSLTVSLSGTSSPHPLSASVASYFRLRFTTAAGARTLEFPTSVTLTGESPVTLIRPWFLVNASGQTLTFRVIGGAATVILTNSQKCLVYSNGTELEQMAAIL